MKTFYFNTRVKFGMKTNKDYTIKNYRGYGEITVPAGTIVTNQTAMGLDENYHFVNDFGWIDKNYPKIARVLKHEATYYGIDIPIEFIER